MGFCFSYFQLMGTDTSAHYFVLDSAKASSCMADTTIMRDSNTSILGNEMLTDVSNALEARLFIRAAHHIIP